jgi:ubiquitin C-terminal hydrolase
MDGFNIDYVPKPFGLKNNSCFCYFNSFIQALATCSSVNRYLFGLRDANIVVKNYINLLNINMRSMGYVPEIDIGSIRNTYSIYLKKTAAKDRNERSGFGNGQEDAHEGLLYLLEMMGDSVATFFNTRYKQYKQCSTCGKKEVVIDGDRYLKENSPFIRITLDQFINFNNDFVGTLTRKEEIIDGYRCDHCHQITKLKKIDYLSKVSEVIIVCIDNYLGVRPQLNLPNSFEIDGVNNPMKYKLIATVEHFGSLQGGHYVSKVLRNEIGGDFLCNDSVVRPDKVTVTQNTYMAFYHIV